MKKLTIFLSLFLFNSVTLFSQDLNLELANFLKDSDYSKLARFESVVFNNELEFFDKKFIKFSDLKKDLPKLKRKTFNSFIDHIKPHSNFEEINLKPIKILHFEDFDCKEEYWDCFYKKYPQSPGLIEISNFAIYKNQALIYYGIIDSNSSGGGLLILFEKDSKGRWSISGVAETWKV